MIVRTYGRRKGGVASADAGGLPRTYSDSTLHDLDHADVTKPYSFSQDAAASSQFDFDFSSSSSQWSTQFDSEPHEKNKRPNSRNGDVSRKSKKPKKETTATLMEAQEFGEMMEHVDEVNFALDGLRKGQPLRITRASLLSLLGICATSQHRRLLRTQGMAKMIIEAILDLKLDDTPSDLAAVTIFYVLTCDNQDDALLESPKCINFLIRFCKPVVAEVAEDKAPKMIGRKLLALRLGAEVSHCAVKRLDSSSAAILCKVRDIFVACKEMKVSAAEIGEMSMPELSPKWVALLAMEKACLSTISLEETTGTVRQAGGNFKEKLRELGGLDAVFEVAMSCHSGMEVWLKDNSPSRWEKEIDMVQNLVLLLKCLKIMENATFLSKENQSHLLQLKGKLDLMEKPMSFTALVISIISILSGLYLHKSVTQVSNEDKSLNPSSGSGYRKSSHKYQSNELVSTSRVVYSISSSENTSTSMNDTFPLKKKLSSSRNVSSSGTASFSSGRTGTFNFGSRKDTGSNWRSSISKNSNIDLSEDNQDPFAFSLESSEDAGLSQKSYISKNSRIDLLEESQDPFAYICGSSEDAGLSQRSYLSEDSKVDLSQESQDPFAFDLEDTEPSQWDLLSGKKKTSQMLKNGEAYRELDDGRQLQLIMSQAESSVGEGHDIQETSYSCSVSKEGSSLLADCLLAAVKVLMNLANENPVGCQQIAANGGLETMSSLIASHFPSFSSSYSDRNDNTSSIELSNPNDRHLTDQELDFLVAILGLLVNLVEKDGQNRSRLAAVSVHLPGSAGFEEESHKDLILLICSIFLANQGAGEESEEAKVLPDEDAVMLQGEQEAVKMIVEAYSALLLAFLSTESKGVRDAIADCLPDHNLAILVPVLDRFVAFHLTLNMISPETHKVVSEVIESCRIR